ncbi:MAG: hypothetical protein CMC08_06260 [Flavobacteriaceae bacterium]|nr:hypothetical protein [Flavobacteriaceae bacterium]
MKLLSKTLIVFLALPLAVLGNVSPKTGKYTKQKTLKKEFSVNANASLTVDNSYGNLDIVTWSENRTVIEVNIITNGNDEDKVQRKLDEITVEFSASAGQVSAKTIFGNQRNSWSWFGNKSNNVSMEVNYTIKMPVTNSVVLSNDYGTINLNKLRGNARISCDYGQLRIGELLADNNLLNFDYTDKSTIGYMKSGKINADYSGYTLEKTERVEISADYTQSEIGQAKEVNYNCDYGKVTIGNANTITGRGDYVTNRIGTVYESLNLNTDYGSIHIDRLTGKTNDVTIRGDYTGIKLGFSPDYNFDFIVNLSYSNLKGEDAVTVTKTSKDNSDKYYAGYHGKQNSGNMINISSNYGGVTFTKN